LCCGRVADVVVDARDWLILPSNSFCCFLASSECLKDINRLLYSLSNIAYFFSIPSKESNLLRRYTLSLVASASLCSSSALQLRRCLVALSARAMRPIGLPTLKSVVEDVRETAEGVPNAALWSIVCEGVVVSKRLFEGREWLSVLCDDFTLLLSNSGGCGGEWGGESSEGSTSI